MAVPRRDRLGSPLPKAGKPARRMATGASPSRQKSPQFEAEKSAWTPARQGCPTTPSRMAAGTGGRSSLNSPMQEGSLRPEAGKSTGMMQPPEGRTVGETPIPSLQVWEGAHQGTGGLESTLGETISQGSTSPPRRTLPANGWTARGGGSCRSNTTWKQLT